MSALGAAPPHKGVDPFFRIYQHSRQPVSGNRSKLYTAPSPFANLQVYLLELSDLFRGQLTLSIFSVHFAGPVDEI